MTARIRGQLGIAALCVATGASAADKLPPLQVDPALLGLPPASKPPAPAVKSAAPATPAEHSMVQPAKASTASAPEPAAKVTPVTLKPSSPEAPAVQSISSPATGAESARATALAPSASRPQQAVGGPAQLPPPAKSNTLSGMQALRVDPALLGHPPARSQLAGAQSSGDSAIPGQPVSGGAYASNRPPEVASQPRIPPLYSAHMKAGLLPGSQPTDGSIYLAADTLDGSPDEELIATGNVELKKKDAVLKADRLHYWPTDDEMEAEGNVDLTRDVDRMSGPKMRLNMTTNTGYFDQPEFLIHRDGVRTRGVSGRTRVRTSVGSSQRSIARIQPLFAGTGLVLQSTSLAVRDRSVLYAGLLNDNLTTHTSTGSGKASKILFEGEGQYNMADAVYSTCVGDNPDWYAQFDTLKLDYDREVGSGENLNLVFKGVPIIKSPWASFSLNNQRKSGLLTPSLSANTKTGFQYLQPFYWDIAPNMDATLYSRAMARRGVQLSGDFRYLNFNYTGQARVEYLPSDRLTGEARYAFSIQHQHDFGAGFFGRLNLNGVSDDDYYADLSTRIAQTSQRNMAREGLIGYSGGWWNASVLTQTFKTLKDSETAAADRPYSRLPRVNFNAERHDLPLGMTLGVQSEYSRFVHRDSSMPAGDRIVFNPSISLPMQTAGAFLIPKIGLHYTRYNLSNLNPGEANSLTRQVPITSVDSGLIFERESNWFGTDLIQTLEPRLYYVYIPRKEQSSIRVFDTALMDFGFAQLFSENRYAGHDRIGDANQLTATVSSKLIDPQSGVELIRAAIGQRYYFKDQFVGLPGETLRTDRKADWLAAFSGYVMPMTYLDLGVQYNPRDSRVERNNVTLRYQPELGKVVSAGYRYTRDLLGQVDISGQWPLTANWAVVGRLNYSTKENRIIENVAGLEYNADCWSVRTVMQRLSTSADSQTTSFFIQLELRDFSSIGSNPYELLRRTIPGYSRNGQNYMDSSIGNE